MPSQGPLSAANAASVAPGTIAWVTPDAAKISDNIYAQATFTIGGVDEETEALRLTDYPFEIEPDSTIDGLEILIERHQSAADVFDLSVRLVYQGATIGNDRAVGDVQWPLADSTRVYGSPTDGWGASLTPLILNDPTFGVQLRATNQSGAGPTARVDAIRATAYYTVALPSAGTGSKIRSRVRELIRDTDFRDPMDEVQVDESIAAAYLMLTSAMPASVLEIQNATRISAGANTFSLPSTAAGRVSPLSYSGELRLKRRADGIFLRRRTLEELNRLRFGLADARRGPPSDFAIWETDSGVVEGLCYPRADRDHDLDLFATLEPDDLLEAPDMDAALIALESHGRAALAVLAASRLVHRMTDDEIARRRLSRRIVDQWQRYATAISLRAAQRRADLESVAAPARRVA